MILAYRWPILDEDSTLPELREQARGELLEAIADAGLTATGETAWQVCHGVPAALEATVPVTGVPTVTMPTFPSVAAYHDWTQTI